MFLVDAVRWLKNKVEAAPNGFKYILGAVLTALTLVAGFFVSRNMKRAALDKADAEARIKGLEDAQKLSKYVADAQHAKDLVAQADDLKAQAVEQHQEASKKLEELQNHQKVIADAKNWKDLDAS